MIEILASVVLALPGGIRAAGSPPWVEPTRAEVLEGLATFYNPGVMEAVAVNRGLIDDPAEYAGWLQARGLVGAVALNPAGDLGRIVWLEGPTGVEGPFLSIDCAAAHDYETRLDQGRIVEVDWQTAERWGMAGPLPAVVHFRDPRLPPPSGKVLQEGYHEDGDLSAIGAF